MASNKILRLWVKMARRMDIEMLVPQHGAPISGRRAINDFFDWIEALSCGLDLFDERDYQLPKQRISTTA
jgi:flavorubredoxin